MQLTKYTHSCVAVHDGTRTLVLDPGVFSEVEQALDGADAVLLTHEHPDHVDVGKVNAAMERDDALTLYAPASVAAQFERFGERVTAVGPGESFDVKGFAVQTFGGQHALIHPRIPMIANVGYLIGGTVFHPGDSFVVPNVLPSTLLVPISAPWAKSSEVVDYVLAVRPTQAYGIHEAVYSEVGRGMVGQQISGLTADFGTSYALLAPNTTVDL